MIFHHDDIIMMSGYDKVRNMIIKRNDRFTLHDVIVASFEAGVIDVNIIYAALDDLCKGRIVIEEKDTETPFVRKYRVK